MGTLVSLEAHITSQQKKGGSAFVAWHVYIWVCWLWYERQKWCIHFWIKWVKNTNARFALNMGNFYLASESPRGENCHILAVDASHFWVNPGQAEQEGRGEGSPKSAKSCWGQTVWFEPEVQQSTSTSEQRQSPTWPKEATASSARAAGFSSDKCTSEWQNHKRGKKTKTKTKMCTGRWLPACCIIVIFWYTETDAEMKGTGWGRIHPMIGVIVAVSQLFHPTCQSSTLRLRSIGWQNTDSSTSLIYTYHLSFSSGADGAHRYPKHLRHNKNHKLSLVKSDYFG